MNTSSKDCHDVSQENMETSCDVLRHYALHLLTAREKERHRLATKIHDKIGQNLLALRIDISMLHARTGEKHPLIHGKTDGMLREIDIAIQNVKNLINRLHPPVLELGLLAAAEWKVKEFERVRNIACSLHVEGDEKSFASYDRYTTSVIRIMQEALMNAVNHASASVMKVSLSNDKGMLTILIDDDGRGVQPGELNKPSTYGLFGIREYARLQNGSFSITQNSPKGTVLKVQLPAI